MSTTFWSNTIWYLLLFITSIVSVVLTYKKSPNRKLTTVFTLSIIGFSYIIEVFLLLIFNAYTYYPKIVNDQFQDAVLGNYFSQISVSTTAVMISVYNLPNTWIFVSAAIYYLIEEFFITLGIYEHNWYKSIYTFIGLLPFFYLVGKWYKNILGTPKKTIYFATLFFGTIEVLAHTVSLPLKLLNIQIFRGSFFNDISKNHTSVVVIYAFILIPIMIILNKWKLQRVQKLVVFLVLFLCQYALYKTGILYIAQGWIFIVTIWDLFVCYFSVAVIDRSL